jgi:hypothetical protein
MTSSNGNRRKTLTTLLFAVVAMTTGAALLPASAGAMWDDGGCDLESNSCDDGGTGGNVEVIVITDTKPGPRPGDLGQTATPPNRERTPSDGTRRPTRGPGRGRAPKTPPKKDPEGGADQARDDICKRLLQTASAGGLAGLVDALDDLQNDKVVVQVHGAWQLSNPDRPLTPKQIWAQALIDRWNRAVAPFVKARSALGCNRNGGPLTVVIL